MKIYKDIEKECYNPLHGEYESCTVETIEYTLDREQVVEAVAYTVTRRLIAPRDFKSVDQKIRQDIEGNLRKWLNTLTMDCDGFQEWCEEYYEDDIKDYWYDELD